VRLNEKERIALKIIVDKEPFLDEEEFMRHLLRKAISVKEEGQYAEFLETAQQITL
jgi:hypothetical protein